MVEQVLKQYRKLRNREKAFMACYEAKLDNAIKGISYNGITEGKRSAKYITGNNSVEFTAMERIELLDKAKEVGKLADEILAAVEELKKEKNGLEMYEVIKLRYLENRSCNDLKNSSIATAHRRKNQALQLLHEKGLWALYYKIGINK